MKLTPDDFAVDDRFIIEALKNWDHPTEEQKKAAKAVMKKYETAAKQKEKNR